MSTLSTWTFTVDDFSSNLNIAKDVMAASLCEAGVIDEDQARAMQEDFALLVLEKGTFGKAIDSILFKNDKKDSAIIKMVQVNNIKYNNKYNNKENSDVHQSEDSDPEGVDQGDN